MMSARNMRRYYAMGYARATARLARAKFLHIG
jgi:hypothetical protein